MIDPVKAKAGRKGGEATDRKRMGHLTDVEYDTLRELERQAHGYRTNTAGSPGAVAAWLRVLADELAADRPAERIVLSGDDPDGFDIPLPGDRPAGEDK